MVLASNSPRRRELLALGNWSFRLFVSNVDESELPGEMPGDYVLRLAEAKAHVAAEKANPQEVIVAADTTVVDDGQILGKPADAADAARMLRRLRGHRHQVYTGLAVLKMNNRKLSKELCVTDVPMRDYSEAEIEAYISTRDPFDKAGAYAIQHSGFHPVIDLQGCFASVMGLPLCHLMRAFETLGISPDMNLPTNCQTHLDYECPVSSAILGGGQVG